MIKLVTGTLHQLELFDEVVIHGAQQRTGFVTVQPMNNLIFGALMTMTGRIYMNAVVFQVIHTFELAIAANRPGNGCGFNIEHFLDFIQQLNRVADVTVHLVDEADDRCVAQATDIHQGYGAWLDTFTAVDHHQCAVDRSQGAVGIFREIFVTGRVEQVDHVLAVGKLHHRGGDGDAALFLHFHPVGRGMAIRFARLDRTGHADGLAHEQQPLGNGGLTGVRVGNNSEGAALGHLGSKVAHGQ